MNNELQWTAKNELTWKKTAGGFSSQWSSPPEGPHGWLRPVEHAATHTLRHQSGNNMQHDQHVDSFKQIAYRQPMMATAKNDSSYSNLSPLESGSRCQFRCMSLLPYLDESPQCTHLLHNRSQNLQHAKLLVPSGGGGCIDESDVPPWQKDFDIKWLSWRTGSKTCMYKTYHNLHWLHLATLSNFIRDAGIWPTRRLKDPLLHWQCMCHGHHSMPSSRAAWKVEKWR